MILAFPAWRRAYFKVTGPVIAEALRRGHQVRLSYHTERKPGEGVSWDEISRVFRVRDLVGQVDSLGPWERIDGVIGPQLETHVGSPDAPVRVSLDYSWEQANAPVRRDLVQVYLTPYQRQIAGGSGPVVGSTQLEAWDVAEPLTELGTGRPMLLLFSCKFAVGGWRRWVYRWVGYRRLLVRLRAWCDREAYRLVVKTRVKHRDPRYVRQIADVVFGDEHLYPPTTPRLMRSATVAVHFQSNVALELAHAGLPQYSVRLPQPHLRHFATTREVYSGDACTLGRWPGVIHLLGAETSPAPFVLDPEQLRRYRARYLGAPGASARVLDLIEARAPGAADNTGCGRSSQGPRPGAGGS